MVTDEWSLYTEKDGSGYYFDLVREVFEPRGINIQIQHMPYPRAVAKVNTGEADMILGAYYGKFDKSWYSDRPVELDKVDVAVTQDFYKHWQGKSSLVGKRVAYKFGYSFNDFFSLEAEYLEVRDEYALIKMLMSGRVDAVLDYERNFRKALQEMGVEEDVVILDGVFFPPIFFAFHNSPKALEYKRIFDTEMLKLRASGKVRELLIKNVGDDVRYTD